MAKTKKPVKHPSGFNAMGKVVPENRLQKAYRAIQHMLPNLSKHDAYCMASRAAHIIRKDQPFRIVGAITSLENPLRALDLTGRYRLMAELLTD